MDKLLLKSKAMGDFSHFSCGEVTLEEVSYPKIIALMHKSVDLKMLKKAFGAWPERGSLVETSYGRLAWSGLDQAFLFGELPAKNLKIKGLNLVDVSDGWVFFSISGGEAKRLLSYFAPIDGRELVEGKVVRTKFGHLMGLLIGRDKGFEVGVMSSFAQNAYNELKHILELVSKI